MLMKSCPDCGKLIPYGAARCEGCAQGYRSARKAKEKESKRIRDRRYNAKRDPKLSRFYHSKEWKALSALVMRESGYRCAKCGKRLGQRLDDGRIVTLEVDHVQPIQSEQGWHMRLDRNNLQALCTDCHNEKHHRFQRRADPRGGQKSF